MRYPQKAFSREKRKSQIIMQFNVWARNGDHEPKTMTRIARALGMTPQKHVSELLDEMVMEGSLTVEKREKSGRWTANNYLVIKSLITEKLVKRRIAVKQHGKVTATLEVPEGQRSLWS